MTTIEINTELLLQLSHIAGNKSYLERTLDFLRNLTKENLGASKARGIAYQNMLRRLSDFQEYERGWDDEDASPLNRQVVKNFKKVLEDTTDSLLSGWTIYPAANGSLLLEYQPREAGINIGKSDFSYYDLSDGKVTGANSCPFTPSSVIETMKQISSHE